MGGYREKVDPTPEGLEELDESTRNSTIERLIAAIQHKHLKPAHLMELTQHFRNRQSIEEKELYRLGDISVGYNRKWATCQYDSFNVVHRVFSLCVQNYNKSNESQNKTPFIFTKPLMSLTVACKPLFPQESQSLQGLVARKRMLFPVFHTLPHFGIPLLVVIVQNYLHSLQ